MVSGILLILSIIEIVALAARGSTNAVQAPVPVPAPLDIYAPSSSAPPGPGHESMNTVQAPVPDTAPSDTYAPSSSAPPGPDHGLTDAVQAPTPNSVPSTANPIPLIELSSSESLPAASSALWDSEDYGWLFDPEGEDKIDTATSSGHGLDHESSSVPTGPDHGLTNVVQAPAPDPVSSTANLNPLIESSISESSPIAPSALPNSKNQWLFEPQGGHMLGFLQPNRNKRPWTDLNLDRDPNPGFVSNFWMADVNQPRPGSALPKEIGQTSEYQAADVQQLDPDPELWILESGSGSNYFPVSLTESVVHPLLTSARLPTRPEHVVTPFESSPNPTQPVDPRAAIYYAAQGKAKESRRISGTTSDVGNPSPARWELQPDERSLGPGE